MNVIVHNFFKKGDGLFLQLPDNTCLYTVYTEIHLKGKGFDLQGLGLKHFEKIKVTRAEDVSSKGFS